MYRAKLGHIPYVFYDQEIDGGERSSTWPKDYEWRSMRATSSFTISHNSTFARGRSSRSKRLFPLAARDLVGPTTEVLAVAEGRRLDARAHPLGALRSSDQCAEWRDAGAR